MTIETQLENLNNSQLESLSDILNSNDFTCLERMLYDELIENEKLYQRLKTHTEIMLTELENANTSKPKLGMAPPKKINPLYITGQYSNINTIKTTRLNIIKNLSELQKDKLDRAFRILNQMAKNSENEAEATLLDPKQVLNALFEHNIQVNNIYGGKNPIESKFEDVDDILDSIDIPSNNDDEVIEDTSLIELKPHSLLINLRDNEYLLLDENDNIIKELKTNEVNELSLYQDNDGKLFCEDFDVYVDLIEEE